MRGESQQDMIIIIRMMSKREVEDERKSETREMKVCWIKKSKNGAAQEVKYVI